MYVEKIFRKKYREAERELKKKIKEAKWELKRERMLNEQRRLFGCYIEEAQNDTELIGQIPYDPDGSLYEEMKKEYESVANELYGNNFLNGVHSTGVSSATGRMVFRQRVFCFSRKQLRLAAESRVVCEHLRKQQGNRALKFEIVVAS